jgi:hypothetical protein
MAVIYMVHHRHGAKVAISEEEAAFDEMYGWERVELDEIAPTPHPLDHDGDGRLGGSLPGEKSTRRRSRPAAQEE